MMIRSKGIPPASAFATGVIGAAELSTDDRDDCHGSNAASR